jgi:hypothetical protein
MQQRVRHLYFSVCHTISAVDHGTRPRGLAARKGEMAITTSTISQKFPVEMSNAWKSFLHATEKLKPAT